MLPADEEWDDTGSRLAAIVKRYGGRGSVIEGVFALKEGRGRGEAERRV